MPSDASTVEIVEMVGLLVAAAPDQVAKLRKSYPEYQDVLKPGSLLGSSAQRQVGFLVAVAKEAVGQGRILAESGAATVHKRLSLARKIEFGIQSLSIVSTSGTLVLILQKSTIAVVTAVASFLVSLGTAGLHMYRAGLSGARDGLPALHGHLVAAVTEAAFLEGRLASYEGEDFNDASTKKAVLQLIEQAERLCRNIRQCASEVSR